MDKKLALQILRFVAVHPYCRQRYIASALNTWLCSERFLDSLHYVYKQGWIDCEYHHDPAQMEFFNLWYLTEAGKSAIIDLENERG